MITILILSTLFLLLSGLTILNIKRVINTARPFRGLIYNSDIVQFFLSLSMLLLTILSIFIFFFHSWKLLLSLILISSAIGNNMLVPFAEKILALVVKRIMKK